MNDVIVVGAVIGGNASAIKGECKGDIRGFDALTGELLWTFRTISSEGITDLNPGRWWDRIYR